MLKAAYTYQQLMSDLKNKIYHPVYFLTGEEPYYIDKITEYISQNVLDEAEKAFNQSILYGKDSDAVAVTNTAKRFPMMSNYQVVIVKEAQELKSFDDLVHYIGQPLKSTILVINYKYKSLDKRKKLFKVIQENAVVFESKKLYDDKIPEWISSALKKDGYSIDNKAAILLTEFLGNDLSKIENELEKLVLTIPEGLKTITPEQIERNIGISKDFNNFELQKALVARDVLKANRIINYFAGNQRNVHITQTITNLYFFFSKVLLYHFLPDKSRNKVAAALKINPFFVTDYEKAARSFKARKVVEIISLLREYDAKSKGYGNPSTDAGDLLKELIFKILH
jgi:DNA polymerase III subunit delta